jgi:Arc/MetJ-type ribon-helix-helix transcriptional regulator
MGYIRISVSIPEPDHRWLRELARGDGVSLSEAVRTIIRERRRKTREEEGGKSAS